MTFAVFWLRKGIRFDCLDPDDCSGATITRMLFTLTGNGFARMDSRIFGMLYLSLVAQLADLALSVRISFL